jgi:DNA-binding NarL/FixJ family response regulator
MNEPIRVLLVDDQPSVRRGLRMRLGLEPDMTVVGEASDGAEALTASVNVEVDVVLMDIEMPVMDGITATTQLSQSEPGCAVVILSLHDDSATRERAHVAGAVDFVAKHEIDRALTDAIRAAASRTS